MLLDTAKLCHSQEHVQVTKLMDEVCLEGELDGELLLVADPWQFKYTTRSDKVVVTFEQNFTGRPECM